eukprot:gnl/MRDRNA2_/MRDRNA2_63192_c0_seq1.p1 gnl/MRDRNA2_/MRDRNA2_63192_c0~~gnl/MRDRNA2_/MRDRNA2_63192_c0_seq1.p1  ORF type:complete len:295 (-),score=49.10 gnl/MRDRNA2_/MRDRNA2_63192_c0_seq1:99-983(-)
MGAVQSYIHDIQWLSQEYLPGSCTSCTGARRHGRASAQSSKGSPSHWRRSSVLDPDPSDPFSPRQFLFVPTRPISNDHLQENGRHTSNDQPPQSGSSCGVESQSNEWKQAEQKQTSSDQADMVGGVFRSYDTSENAQYIDQAEMVGGVFRSYDTSENAQYMDQAQMAGPIFGSYDTSELCETTNEQNDALHCRMTDSSGDDNDGSDIEGQYAFDPDAVATLTDRQRRRVSGSHASSNGTPRTTPRRGSTGSVMHRRMHTPPPSRRSVGDAIGTKRNVLDSDEDERKSPRKIGGA